MAYTTIDDPSAYFHTQLYTGDGSSNNAITNDANSGDFKPDWLWIKSRSYADLHQVFDSSRGRDKRIFLNLTNAEGDSSPDNFLKSFDTDGFTIGNDAGLNTNGGTLVAWQWKANGGTTASNTDGSITSTVQANTTAGFSIVTYTGTGSNATVGHGLGATPKVVIVKNRDSAGNNWFSHWTGLLSSDAHLMYIASTDAEASNATGFNSTAPTSSVFSVGTNTATNENTSGHVAYCFAEKQGYSKFGSYTGNGNADGSFVYTGFKTKWLMTRRFNSAGSWTIFDNTLDDNTSGKHGNTNTQFLQANNSNAEATTGANFMDFLSNGFKCRGTDGGTNGNGDTYVYMAFAESPFVSSEGVPTTAR